MYQLWRKAYLQLQEKASSDFPTILPSWLPVKIHACQPEPKTKYNNHEANTNLETG